MNVKLETFKVQLQKYMYDTKHANKTAIPKVYNMKHTKMALNIQWWIENIKCLRKQTKHIKSKTKQTTNNAKHTK